MDYRQCIREISNFPKKGIIFKDITPIFKDALAFRELITDFQQSLRDYEFDYIAGIEARGFLVAAPLALMMHKGFIPIRKQGKLPGQVIQADYELEYGTNTLEMQKDAFAPGSKILIVDDLLATGGTIKASIELVEKLQGIVQGLAFILELNFLNGRQKLREYPIITLMRD